MTYWAHPTAVIDEGAVIGEGTRVWHWVHVSGGARIGSTCILGQNVYIGGRAVVGSNCKIQNNVSIYDEVTLEDDVFCGPSMVFTNVLNPRSHVPRQDEYRSTLVRRGATLGANCTVICGVTIGEYAFVGAGSVVTRDVPAFALLVGVPGRVAGWVCRCGVRLPAGAALPLTARCDACATRYRLRQAGAALEIVPAATPSMTSGA